MGGFHVDTAELTDAAGMIRSSVDLADGMDMNAAVKGGNVPRPGTTSYVSRWKPPPRSPASTWPPT
jgi:hypothetical protein